FNYEFFNWTTKQQYDFLTVSNCVPASTLFYNIKGVAHIGITNDEDVPLKEDWPKWLQLTKKGIKLYFVDKVLVRYRLHDESISTSTVARPYNPLQAYTNAMFFAKYQFLPQLHRNDLDKNAVLNKYQVQKKEYYTAIKHLNNYAQYPHQFSYNYFRFLQKLHRVLRWFCHPVQTIIKAKRKSSQNTSI
ncbi:MAG: hypothetical protein HUK15_09315, partial [Bacteroidales bacterium]|nr:hypothetical protein [Bacteroidales bacterium]